jgi:hypothetical protein
MNRRLLAATVLAAFLFVTVFALVAFADKSSPEQSCKVTCAKWVQECVKKCDAVSDDNQDLCHVRCGLAKAKCKTRCPKDKD